MITDGEKYRNKKKECKYELLWCYIFYVLT